DVDLHAVVVTGLPKKAYFGNEMLLFPAFVVLCQVWQEGFHERIAGINSVDCRGGVRQPTTIAARLSAGRPEPIAGIVASESRVAQPAHFIELMPGGTTDCTVGSRPEWTVDEFRETVAALG